MKKSLLFRRQLFQSRQGMTLMEVLLYSAIVGVIVLIIGAVLVVSLDARQKNQTINEVESTGQMTLTAIEQAIRQAKNVIRPLPQRSGTVLELEMYDPSQNPTIFEAVGTELIMTVGTQPPVTLTNSRVEVYKPTFANTSRLPTSQSVKVRIAYLSVNPSGRFAYQYGKLFQTTATLRP